MPPQNSDAEPGEQESSADKALSEIAQFTFHRVDDQGDRDGVSGRKRGVTLTSMARETARYMVGTFSQSADTLP